MNNASAFQVSACVGAHRPTHAGRGVTKGRTRAKSIPARVLAESCRTAKPQADRLRFRENNQIRFLPAVGKS